MEDVEEAIVLARTALRLCPQEHPNRSMYLDSLAVCLHTRYRQLGVAEDLEEATNLNQAALTLRPRGHADRSMSLNHLVPCLVARYKKLGVLEHLEEAVLLGQEALDLCPQEHYGRTSSLISLGSALTIRYRQHGNIADLEEAIRLSREALELCLHGHPDRSSSLISLADALAIRYRRHGDVADLNEAIVMSQEALGLCPHGHPDRSSSLTHFASALVDRYKRGGVMKYLDTAIAHYREALFLLPKRHPDRPAPLNNLATALSTRYNRFGDMDMEDLNEAVDLQGEALDLCPQGHPLRWFSLNNLAGHLYTRYGQLGDMEDIERAIFSHRQALELCPQGQPNRPTSLNNLAECLCACYEKLGIIENLDEAVILHRESLRLRPQGDTQRPGELNNMARCLFIRHNQLGVVADVDEAIALHREALALHREGNPSRSASLNNLADCLLARFNVPKNMEEESSKKMKMEYLEEAIILHQKALELRPQGNTYRSLSLNNLATVIFTRYNELGHTEDLEQAIALHREALHLCQEGHPERPMSLDSLALCLFTQYRQFGAAQNLDEAIVLVREALKLLPQGHPKRSTSLNHLASYLCARSSLTNLEDREEAFRLYTQLADINQLVSSNDLTATRAWITEAETFQHPTVVLAYETSLRLLVQHLAILPSLPRHLVIFKNLTSSLAADAFSACLRSDRPARAIELLEQGRGVFWSQLSRLRSPLDDVIASGSEGQALADEFMRLSSLIRGVLNSPSPDQHGRLCHLNTELQRLVTNIRGLPGLSCFLLPSLYSDLKCAASEGPVIIVNASQYGCDALIVLRDQDPIHVPLQTTQERVRDLVSEFHMLNKRTRTTYLPREFAFFLRKLWDEIVLPIADLLQTILPHRSRIWWCPTAEFTLLPLHAAGPYRTGQQKLMDLYISSYTPTLSALIRARRPSLMNFATQRKRFVAIGLANPVNENRLISVGAELGIVDHCVEGLSIFTRVEGEESTVPRTVEKLGNNEWVHLACHGVPNRTQPFESAFALHNGYLTVERIAGCDLMNAEFAYLSACHTTVGGEQSPDEVIHLASAMQFAGFRSVIGTMWAVDDAQTNVITSTFYEHIVDGSGHLDHTRAARALNETMTSVHASLDQRILYIHLGA